MFLDKIAVGLGVKLSGLMGRRGGCSDAVATSPSTHAADQAVWIDPGSGYVRRALSPANFRCPILLVEVLFPVGARVAFGIGPRNA